jgi:DNA replication ATP-dependent helicase Dna2
MNVSFTRARSKLVIFGSRKTLKGDVLLGQFFELMEGRGWVYELPPNAHLVHRRDLDSRQEQSQEEEEDSGDGALDEEEVNGPEQTFPEELTMCPEMHEDLAADMDLTLVEMKSVDVKDDALKWADHVGNQDDDDDVEVVDVKKSPSKVVAGDRSQDDDEDVEIVNEFYIAPKPKSTSSKKHSEFAKHGAKPAKKRKAEPMVIDIEDEVEGKEDDIMIVNSKPASSLAGKKKGAASKQAEASASVSATGAGSSKAIPKSTSNGSLKRSRPSGKENTSGKGSGGMGPLDKFFLVAKGSGAKTGSSTSTADDGSAKSERPTKKVKAEPPVPSKKESTKPGTSTGRKAHQKDVDRKASGLLKGRPILKDLVESEY